MKPAEVEKAIKHLKKDKLLSKVISKSQKPGFKRGSDYFNALVRSIIYQQISGKAAENISKRFKTLFKDGIPNAKNILKLKDVDFKKAGISPQKMKYLRDLSLKFIDGTLDSSLFHKMSDEEIRLHLISVKGIGRWTADMFLMFTLCRQDVLPTGDLGIQKGMQKLFKLKKLPDSRKMEKLAKDWSPYRTVASWYLWRVVDEGESQW